MSNIFFAPSVILATECGLTVREAATRTFYCSLTIISSMIVSDNCDKKHRQGLRCAGAAIQELDYKGHIEGNIYTCLG